jgi:hypothetical protein
VVILAEKPQVKKSNISNANETKQEMEELKQKLDVLSSVPKKKYPFPVTSSQEIGWEEMQQFKPMKYHNKASCKETQYANDYVTMTMKSPFAKKVQE